MKSPPRVAARKVPLLRAHGLTLRVLSRSPRADFDGVTHVRGPW
ncbi:hypothetical protein ACPCVL_30540 [Streptomyces koyangensis]